MASTKWILCDLGKTLVQFEHETAAKRLGDLLQGLCAMQGKKHPGTLKLFAFFFGPRIGKSPRNVVLERGEEDLSWLAEEFRQSFDLEMPVAPLREIWCDIFTTQNDDVLAGMQRARDRGIKVAICSNTSAPHWEHIVERYPDCAALDDDLFLSFRMGKMKTDPGFFEQIIATTGAAPEEHLFLDDLKENLKAAKAAGIETVLYNDGLPPHPAWD